MRQWLLKSWVWITTGVMVGLVILTQPTKPDITQHIIVLPSKYECLRDIIADINHCGENVVNCYVINAAPLLSLSNIQCWGGYGVGQRVQKVVKLWLDCNNDGRADCEVWFAWDEPKPQFASKDEPIYG